MYRLTAYLFSGSLPMYSQAHCLCILRLTAYVFSGSPHMYSQAYRLYSQDVFSGSLARYSQAHCLVFSGSLPSILSLPVYSLS